jgi:hypothetical protein
LPTPQGPARSFPRPPHDSIKLGKIKLEALLIPEAEKDFSRRRHPLDFFPSGIPGARGLEVRAGGSADLAKDNAKLSGAHSHRSRSSFA